MVFIWTERFMGLWLFVFPLLSVGTSGAIFLRAPPLRSLGAPYQQSVSMVSFQTAYLYLNFYGVYSESKYLP